MHKHDDKILLYVKRQLSCSLPHKKATMQNIPIDILTSIFGCLSNKYLVHRVGLVNKQWRNTMLHPFIWRTRTIEIDRFLDTLPLSFIEECDITKYTLNSKSHLKQVVLQFPETVTRLNLGIFINMNTMTQDEYFDIPVFTAMQEFSAFDASDTCLKLTQHMPNLTSLYTFFNIIGESLIYSLKNLKRIEKVGDPISEANMIEMFQKLPLLEDVSVTVDVSDTSSVWNSVFQIEGVSNRLKKLSIESYDSITDTTSPSNIVINNLNTLHILASLDSHTRSILYASQHTLIDLRLFTQANDDLSGVKLPKLKHLCIDGQLPINMLSLLASCQNTLKDLSLELNDEQEYMNEIETNLNFSQLNSLIIRGQPSNFYTTLLENIDGGRLVTLQISAYIVPIIEDMFPAIASKLTNLRHITAPFKLVNLMPKYLLHNITLLNFTAFGLLDEDTLNLLLSFPKLATLDINPIDGCMITADNWLVRLLNNCKNLKQLVLNAITESKVDFTELELHSRLTKLDINYSSVRQHWNLLLKNTPKLRKLKCSRIPLDDLSNLLEVINKYSVASVELSVVTPSEYSNTFNNCYYLDNPSIKNVILSIQAPIEFDTCFISYEQLLLLVLCIGSEQNRMSTAYIYDHLNYPEFGNDVTTIEYGNVASVQNKLTLQVIPMIQSISEQKRETLMNTMNTETSTVMSNFCVQVWEKLILR
jgi:hypothetical protein